MVTEQQRKLLTHLRDTGPLVLRPEYGPEVKTHAQKIHWVRNTGIKPLGTLRSLFYQGLVRCSNYPEDQWLYFPDNSVWEVTEKALNLLGEKTRPLDAAWEIARREGFAAVTRERIARECGLSTGSVSYLLGGMDPVYQHVLDMAHKENVRLKYK